MLDLMICFPIWLFLSFWVLVDLISGIANLYHGRSYTFNMVFIVPWIGVSTWLLYICLTWVLVESIL